MAIQRQTEDVQKWPSFDGNQVFQEFDTPPALPRPPPPPPSPPPPSPDFSTFYFRSKDLCTDPCFEGKSE